MDVSGCGLRNLKSYKGSKISLPDDVISKILLEFSADELENVMRYVCRDWDRVIHHPDFIKRHRRSRACLLVQTGMTNPSGTRVGYIVKVEASEKDELPSRRATINISDENHQYRSVGDTCDGLVLVEDFARADGKVVCHVVNPLRKQHLTLSPAPAHARVSVILSSIARASSSGQYKVVLDYATSLTPLKVVVLVSTVGGDGSWRSVDVEHVPPDDLRDLHWGYRNSVGGFVYWDNRDNPTSIISLDVENETMLKVNFGWFIAQVGYGKRVKLQCEYENMRFIKSERFLIRVVKQRYPDWRHVGFWEFWVLVDTKHGEWRKLYEFDVEKLLRNFPPTGAMGRWQPHFVLEDDDVVVFSASSSDFCIGYEVKTGKTFRFGKTPIKDPFHSRFFAHVQSLVPLQG